MASRESHHTYFYISIITNKKIDASIYLQNKEYLFILNKDHLSFLIINLESIITMKKKYYMKKIIFFVLFIALHISPFFKNNNKTEAEINDIHSTLYLNLLFDYPIAMGTENEESPEETIGKTVSILINSLNSKELLNYIIASLDAIYNDPVIALNRSFSREYIASVITMINYFSAQKKKFSSKTNSSFSEEVTNKIYHTYITLCQGKPHSQQLALLMSMKIFFWVIQSHEKIKNIFHPNSQESYKITPEEIFIFTFPLHALNISSTYEKINFDFIFNKYLTTKTTNADNYLKQKKIPLFCNQDMAYDLITRETKILHILTTPENKPVLEKIRHLIEEKIIPIMNEKEALEKELVSYFLNLIPSKFPFNGSKKSSRFLYGLSSLFYQYMNPGLLLTAKNFLDSFLFSSNTKFSHFSKTFLSPFLPLWPGESDNSELAIKKSIVSLEKKIKDTTLSENDKDLLLKEFAPQIRAQYVETTPIFTLGDQINYFKYSRNPYAKFLQKSLFFLIPTAIIIQGVKAIQAGWFMKESAVSLIAQYRNIINHNKYLLLLKKIIIYTKELKNIYTQMCKDNGISLNETAPEFQQIYTVFSGNNKAGAFKEILSFNKNKVTALWNKVTNFLAPGITSHFYFNTLMIDKDIKKLHTFLGYMEILVAKTNLLLRTTQENTALKFSIPTLLSNQEETATFEIKNMWYAGPTAHPIPNSISLGKENRNMLLVAPVGGGKTVLLSTLISCFYLANLGIVPAENMQYTYFKHIVDHLTFPYTIGEGLSGHLAERASMHILETIIEESKDEKLIIFIDEIFKHTRPDLALDEAFTLLRKILWKTNMNAIVTTHFPDMIKIIEDKELSIGLFYLVVDYIAGQFFVRYRLAKDDEENWWIRDKQKAMLYQQSLTKQTLYNKSI